MNLLRVTRTSSRYRTYGNTRGGSRATFVRRSTFCLAIIYSRVTRHLCVLALISSRRSRQASSVRANGSRGGDRRGVKSRLFCPRSTVNVYLLFVAIFRPRAITRVFFRLALSRTQVNVQLRFRASEASFHNMLRRTANGQRKNRGMKDVMFFLVSNGNRPHKRGAFANGNHDQVNRISFNAPLKNVSLGEVRGASSQARGKGRLSAKGNVVNRFVIRRRVTTTGRGTIGQNRAIRVIFRALSSDRDLASLMLCRHVVFRKFQCSLGLKRTTRYLGLQVLSIRGLTNSKDGLRFKVRYHGMV